MSEESLVTSGLRPSAGPSDTGAKPSERTFQLVLDVTVRGFTAEEIAECGPTYDEFEEYGAPEIDEYSARDIADLIAPSILADETQDEMFAGSGMFIRIADVHVVSATAKAEGRNQ